MNKVNSSSSLKYKNASNSSSKSLSTSKKGY